MVVSDYAEAASRKFKILEKRITKKEFSDFTVRFTSYALHTLELNRMLAGIKVADFLSAKLIPVDTKGLHGKFLKGMVQRALERHGYSNVDPLLQKHNVSVLRPRIDSQVDPKEVPNGKLFCTEKYIEDIENPNKGGPKKFDVIIISDLAPRHVFELNFYTTEGTKIGINEDEYLALNDVVRKHGSVEFHWITDGNYWLSL
ncbi:MAG TPA: DpnII family type II restriction endonuclease, partial [Candidatus Hodarchaeales archaeon]|nr:DpnII family type II restriction endonuclease [Candidatus Hodarchaeales archaeon]